MTDTLEEVRFLSGDIALAGHIRRPNDNRPPYPALMFTGPFTGVKEQVTGTDAAALAIGGYLTLAFDHRDFGASDGVPRQHEDVAGKLADLRDDQLPRRSPRSVSARC